MQDYLQRSGEFVDHEYVVQESGKVSEMKGMREGGGKWAIEKRD